MQPVADEYLVSMGGPSLFQETSKRALKKKKGEQKEENNDEEKTQQKKSIWESKEKNPLRAGLKNLKP